MVIRPDPARTGEVPYKGAQPTLTWRLLTLKTDTALNFLSIVYKDCMIINFTFMEARGRLAFNTLDRYNFNVIDIVSKILTPPPPQKKKKNRYHEQEESSLKYKDMEHSHFLCLM